MKNVYGYIRISDKYKQSDGASLPEQKRILLEYAKANNLKIIHFYEEKRTASKRGRPLFNEMLDNLLNKKAEGVIMHKIDRSSRNLHDWANIGDLIDNNIEVYFAHENLNLRERGGRLSADIQAVMASDYVRNLRQETIKGLYGRLEQGIWPFGAPVGYVDNGKAELKTICPIQGKLVKEVFKKYATGKYSVKSLSAEMEKLGLKNQRGNRVCKNGITKILKNPFYIGLMKVKDQTYTGKHQSLISTDVFKRVQTIINGRQTSNGFKHNYLFRKILRCHECNYVMSGEMQKGMVYYRCKTKSCPTKCIREDHIEHYVKNMLSTISLRPNELKQIKDYMSSLREDREEINKKKLDILGLQKDKLSSQKERLLDAYLESAINKEEYELKKESILFSIRELEEKIETINTSQVEKMKGIEEFVELCNKPLKFYQNAVLEEKREMLQNISPNLTAKGKGIVFSMLSPYLELANRDILLSSALNRDNVRTLTLPIIYTDKNTSGIQPKPLNKVQTEQFFNILLENNSILPAPKPTKNNEVSKDHPSTE